LDTQLVNQSVLDIDIETLKHSEVRQLALQYPSSQFNDGPLLVYLTARDRGRGEAALNSLHEDAGLKEAKALKGDGGLTEVECRQLDISDTKSIHDLAEFLKKTHPNGIDFGSRLSHRVYNTKD
jgi:carbonyl reductase 1